jgi:hypothetical protein
LLSLVHDELAEVATFAVVDDGIKEVALTSTYFFLAHLAGRAAVLDWIGICVKVGIS